MKDFRSRAEWDAAMDQAMRVACKSRQIRNKLAFIVSDCPKNNNERAAVPCLQD